MDFLLDQVASTRFMGLNWSWWTIVGFMGQTLFFMRFIVQWIVSERRRDSVIPVAFWWFSIIGSLISAIYFLGTRDPIGILGYLPNSIVYIRNLQLIQKRKHQQPCPASKSPFPLPR